MLIFQPIKHISKQYERIDGNLLNISVEAYFRPPLLWIPTLYIALAFAGLPVFMDVVIYISTNALSNNDNSNTLQAYY